VVQHELMPALRAEAGTLTPKLEKVVQTLEWVRMEEFTGSTWRGWGGCGRPEQDRGMLDSGFVAKAVLGLSTTAGLIERLWMDRVLRRICGFPMCSILPDESTFSRAFAEFVADGLAERIHAALVRKTLGEHLIGHISRDGTAIEAREKPARKVKAAREQLVPKKRGRLRKGQVREAAPGKLAAKRQAPVATPERTAARL
jgi:hypothetical protein